ncbi:MAG: Transcriptional regulator, HxlR family, partial [uncultured Actinomycetospora sp.]
AAGPRLRPPGLRARPRPRGAGRALDPARPARLLLRRPPLRRPAGPPRHPARGARRPAGDARRRRGPRAAPLRSGARRVRAHRGRARPVARAVHARALERPAAGRARRRGPALPPRRLPRRRRRPHHRRAVPGVRDTAAGDVAGDPFARPGRGRRLAPGARRRGQPGAAPPPPARDSPPL